MSAAEDSPAPVDEFDHIARLLRPLTDDAPEALGLQDDAAVLPGRPGYDLVVTKDAIVAGVHFLPGAPMDLIARKLLRVNLSDIAAMGGEPYAYFLAVSWPHGLGWDEREAFATGLRQDQDAFGVTLMGGDTVSTPGPLTASATVLAWVPAGAAVTRAGARPGDRILVSGTIGDGYLGLKAASGELPGLAAEQTAWLEGRYNLPEPRLGLAAALRRHAAAAADVSDGLVADAGHLARASGAAVAIALDRLPLSAAARAWLERQADCPAALAALATGGDDYEIVCAVRPDAAEALIAAAEPIALTDVGVVEPGEGARALYGEVPVALARTGWRHG